MTNQSHIMGQLAVERRKQRQGRPRESRDGERVHQAAITRPRLGFLLALSRDEAGACLVVDNGDVLLRARMAPVVADNLSSVCQRM